MLGRYEHALPLFAHFLAEASKFSEGSSMGDEEEKKIKRKRLTLEQGSCPSHRVRDARLSRPGSDHHFPQLPIVVESPYHAKHATFTGGLANFLRITGAFSDG